MKTILLASTLAVGAIGAQAATLDFSLGGSTLTNQSSLSYSVSCPVDRIETAQLARLTRSSRRPPPATRQIALQSPVGPCGN